MMNMQSRKIVLALCVGVLATTSASLLSGCGGGGGSATAPNSFAGRYNGTYPKGTLSFTVNNRGRVSATINEGTSTLNGTGSVDAAGNVTIKTTASNGPDETFIGIFDNQGKNIETGTNSWSSCPSCVKDGCLAPCFSGTWTAAKMA